MPIHCALQSQSAAFVYCCCVQAKTRMVGMLGSAKNNVSSYYGRPVVVDEASGTPTQILLASCTSLHAYVTNHGT